jgi:superoxide dismutase, Cu-Zn family
MGLRATAAFLGAVVCVLGAASPALAGPALVNPALVNPVLVNPVPVRPAHSSVTFAPYAPGARGITYDTAAVPAGSGATVFAVARHGGTTVVLRVRGLLPGHEYGAHVHRNPCGATGDAAGPHVQHVPDPVQPSVDPSYANPRNEIWLDLTTDADGNAMSTATVAWRFGDRPAGSVVLHAEHTHTEPGHAGTAGARLACVTVDFLNTGGPVPAR